MQTRIPRILILIIICFFLTGCWDFKDINQRSVILSVGVDRSNGKIEFCGEAATLSETGQSQEQISATSVYTYYSKGDTFEKANLNAAQKFPFPIFLGATRVVAFGEGYAKEGIEPYINRIDNIYDYRKTLLTVISSVPILELFSIKVETNVAVGFFIEDAISYLSDRGKTVNTPVGEIVSKISFDNVGFVLPYIGIENNKIVYKGLAVMKDSKLIGVIKIEDVDGLTYIIGTKANYTKVLSDPFDDNNSYSFLLQIVNRDIITDYVDGNITARVNIEMVGQLQYQYYNKKLTSSIRKKLENKLQEKIEQEIEVMLERTQKEFKSDIIDLARYFKAQNPKIFEKIDWKKQYLDSEFTINVNVKLQNQNFRDYE